MAASAGVDASLLASRAAKIWILTWGTRGDHEPAAALALALRDSGHNVQVFGCSRMRRMFASRNLAFDALNAPPIMHAANWQARAELQELAEANGFQGPGREAEYMFDLVFLWHESSLRHMRRLYMDGTPGFQMLVEVLTTAKAFCDFLVTGKGLDKAQHRCQVYFEMRAEESGRSLDDYMAHSREQRRVFRNFIRRIADDLGWEPLDVMNTFHTAFTARLGEQLKALDGKYAQQQQVAEDQVTAFYAWQDQELADLELYLDKYWKHWCSHLSLEGNYPVGDGLGEAAAVSLQNMLFSVGSLAPQEMPDLVICHEVILSASMLLQKRYGIDVLPWHTTMPAGKLEDLVKTYAGRCLLEGSWEGVPAPLLNGGPLAFIDRMQSTRQLVSVSVLMAKDFEASRQPLKACFTGKWVLDECQQMHSDDSGLYGTPDEKALLEQFLGSGEEPPVYMGWGSMVSTCGIKALAGLVVKTLRKAGMRGIFVAGWSGVDQGALKEAIAEEYERDPEQIANAEGRLLFLKSISHESLFRRCACTVHHGGAGTLHAALRSGVPTIVSPVVLDQFPNGDWVESLGCGVKVQQLAELKPDALADALAKVLGDENIKAKSREVADAMACELGVHQAVSIVEKCLRDRVPVEILAEHHSPCMDGLYDMYIADDKIPFPPTMVRGTGLFTADGGTPVGQIWSGVFVIEDTEGGIRPGTYSVQAAWPVLGILRFGNVSEDMKVVTLEDGGKGFSMRWVAPAP